MSARLRRATPSLAASTQRAPPGAEPPPPSEPSGRLFGGCLPKLMLLTVADKPLKPFELWLDITTDTAPVERSAAGLDGLYIEFQTQMLRPEGKAALQRLSKSYTIGVWGRAGKDPDNLATLQELVDGGVTFVNSDLPRSFLEESIA